MKGRGAPDLREIDRWDHGVRRLAYPNEAMQWASHTVEINGDMWLFDPVDAPDVSDLFAEFGGVTGVVVRFDRHKHGLAALVNRHEVPVYVALWMTGVTGELDMTVERFRADLADSGFETFRLVDRSVPPQQEAGFYHDEYDLFIALESVGTVGYFCTRGEHLGVHPIFRPFPSWCVLSRYDLDWLLIDHGASIPMNMGDGLRAVLGNARRGLLGVYARALTLMLLN